MISMSSPVVQIGTCTGVYISELLLFSELYTGNSDFWLCDTQRKKKTFLVFVIVDITKQNIIAQLC